MFHFACACKTIKKIPPTTSLHMRGKVQDMITNKKLIHIQRHSYQPGGLHFFSITLICTAI